MTLLRRILTEKRTRVLPLVVALAINVAFYAVAVYPLTVKVANAEQRAAAADQTLRTVRESHAAARETRLGKDRADEELRKFYRDVLPSDLTAARRITYPRLARLAEQTNLRYQRRSSTPERERGSSLGSLRTTMVLAGEYRDVRRFIYELESAPDFVVIEDVSLAQSQDPSTGLVLTLGVSTYYWVGRDE